MVKEKYTKKYLEKLDQEHKMIPLYFDQMLKSVMVKNMEVFKKFLILTLDLNIDINHCNIQFLDKEFPKEMMREKGKTVDINVRLNDKYVIDVEMNACNFEEVKIRNSSYLDKLRTTLLETGENYKMLNNREIYQLNLNLKDQYKNLGENIIVSYDITTQTIYIDNKKIYLKHLAYYRELYYNNYRNLTYDELFLVAITAETFTELDDILSKILTVKERTRFLESVINMSLDEFCLHEWEKEKLDAMVIDIGKENAFNEGKKHGIEQTTINIIKEMLIKKVAYKDISDITGKSIEEIKEIEQTIHLD